MIQPGRGGCLLEPQDTPRLKGSKILMKVGSVLLADAENKQQREIETVKARELDADIVTPVFKDLKGDKYKVISFFAKKARGQMARFIIENELNEPDGMKKFKTDGYRYNRAESSARELVFTRDVAPSAK